MLSRDRYSPEWGVEEYEEIPAEDAGGYDITRHLIKTNRLDSWLYYGEHRIFERIVCYILLHNAPDFWSEVKEINKLKVDVVNQICTTSRDIAESLLRLCT